MKVMKEIKYEVDQYGRLITECPYGIKTQSGKIFKVSSMKCETCPYFVSDNEDGIVECKYDDSHNEELTSHEGATTDMKMISAKLYDRLEYLGIIDGTGVRGRNFGSSDYNEHTITVWSIWLDYPNLSEFEKMMIKYILREKDEDPKELDLKKVIHYAEERLRQIECLKKQSK